MASTESLPEDQLPHADEPKPAVAAPAPSTPAQSTPAPSTQAETRPRPAFGEYAPEGWEWKPEGSEQAATPGATPANAASATAAPATGGALAGVPHNLGATPGSSAPSPAPANTTQPHQSAGSHGAGDPAPYRATEAPPAAPVVVPYGANTAPQPRIGDRIATVSLLAVGAFGALIMAQSMLGLGTSFLMMAEALELKELEIPTWVSSLGTISGLTFFAIYAVVLIFSIRRMRARKITFWVPLTAGAVVFIAAMIITTIAMMAIPELMQAASDPGAVQKFWDYSLTTTP